MIHTLAIDPGLKPGCVELDVNGTVVRASHKLEPWATCPTMAWDGGEKWPLVATEGQWMFRHSKSDNLDPNDLLTLAFRAGFTLASIPAIRRMRIPPSVWRGGSSVNKQVMQNRILRTLSPTERELFKDIPKGRHGDVLDAIGIGRAAQRLAQKANTEYDYSL